MSDELEELSKTITSPEPFEKIAPEKSETEQHYEHIKTKGTEIWKRNRDRGRDGESNAILKARVVESDGKLKRIEPGVMRTSILQERGPLRTAQAERHTPSDQNGENKPPEATDVVKIECPQDTDYQEDHIFHKHMLSVKVNTPGTHYKTEVIYSRDGNKHVVAFLPGDQVAQVGAIPGDKRTNTHITPDRDAYSKDGPQDLSVLRQSVALNTRSPIDKELLFRLHNRNDRDVRVLHYLLNKRIAGERAPTSDNEYLTETEVHASQLADELYELLRDRVIQIQEGLSVQKVIQEVKSFKYAPSPDPLNTIVMQVVLTSEASERITTNILEQVAAVLDDPTLQFVETEEEQNLAAKGLLHAQSAESRKLAIDRATQFVSWNEPLLQENKQEVDGWDKELAEAKKRAAELETAIEQQRAAYRSSFTQTPADSNTTDKPRVDSPELTQAKERVAELEKTMSQQSAVYRESQNPADENALSKTVQQLAEAQAHVAELENKIAPLDVPENQVTPNDTAESKLLQTEEDLRIARRAVELNTTYLSQAHGRYDDLRSLIDSTQAAIDKFSVKTTITTA